MDNAELDYKAHRTTDMYKLKNDLLGGSKKKERFLKDDERTRGRRNDVQVVEIDSPNMGIRKGSGRLENSFTMPNS